MYFADFGCARPIRPQLREPLVERLRRREPPEELLPELLRRRLVVDELELRRLDPPSLPSSSSSSSSSPKSASRAPWRTPLVLPEAPPSVIPSISSGRPWVSVAIRSSRLTASAKRRYVSTLAITIRASIVR